MRIPRIVYAVALAAGIGCGGEPPEDTEPAPSTAKPVTEGGGVEKGEILEAPVPPPPGASKPRP